MLDSLQQIFATQTIEVDTTGERIPVHSNTTMEQGLFLQELFDMVKPARSLEVGFAYGISSLFILQKHSQYQSPERSHIVIEPDEYWGPAAMHNIKKEGLASYIDIKKDYSDKILTQLFHEDHRIQYAYIDTTKRFDVVMQDFYFIDKIMDTGGVVILDDCGGRWPGIQRVARYIHTLPHYKFVRGHNKRAYSLKLRIAHGVCSLLMKAVPFKARLFPGTNFKTDRQLGLDFACIAFRKTGNDQRSWDWDKEI